VLWLMSDHLVSKPPAAVPWLDLVCLPPQPPAREQVGRAGMLCNVPTWTAVTLSLSIQMSGLCVFVACVSWPACIYAATCIWSSSCNDKKAPAMCGPGMQQLKPQRVAGHTRQFWQGPGPCTLPHSRAATDTYQPTELNANMGSTHVPAVAG
jgi:hypothetical protein